MNERCDLVFPHGDLRSEQVLVVVDANAGNALVLTAEVGNQTNVVIQIAVYSGLPAIE